MKKKTNFTVDRARFMFVYLPNVWAEKQLEKAIPPPKQLISAPSSVLNVTKENTYPNQRKIFRN